jgi:signal recognition particle receptor subunit beta
MDGASQRTRQPYKQKAQVVKLVVAGLPRTGKTSFIQAISQYTEWQAEEQMSWFFGRVRVDSSLLLHFLEPPPRTQYDFLWLQEMMSKLRASGYIVLADSTKPQHFGQFLSILYTVRGYHAEVPLVVAATKQDHPKAWNYQDIQLGLGIRDFSVYPCVTTDRNSVREVVVDVLHQILG